VTNGGYPTEGGTSHDEDRTWAELEGATEGPHGRGRDQEVISQTERATSKEAAADRTVAAAASYESSLALSQADGGIDVVQELTQDAASVRVLVLRSAELGGRTVTLRFDLRDGSVTEHRSDGSFRSIDPFDPANSDRARDAIRASMSWLRNSRDER
jgi:hypothetical protein